LELLAFMLELCPRGHEMYIFFTHLFSERLPAELRITLGKDDDQNVRALAKKADALWSLHGMMTSFTANVVSLVDVDETSSVAAMSSGGSNPGKGGRSHGGQGRQAGGGTGRGQQPGVVATQSKAAASLLPREMARIQTSLCLKRFKYGDKAHSCTPTCNWGN
jgi:hypothetical protein